MFDKIPRSHLYTLTAIIIWTFAYPGTRFVVLGGYIGSSEMAFVRNLSAAIFFAIFVAIKRKGLPSLKDWPVFLLSGALGFALYTAMFNKGLESLDGGTSATILATVPLLCSVLSTLFFKERISRIGWLGMLLSFSGVALLSLWENGLAISAGIVWTLIAAISMSFYSILQRYLGSPRKSGHYSALQITAYSFFGANVLASFQAPVALGQFMAAPFEHQLVTVLMGIFPSGISFLMWSKALTSSTSTSSVANYLFMLPLLTIIVCYVMLDEKPGAGTLLGGAVILLGLWVFRISIHPKVPKFKTQG